MITKTITYTNYFGHEVTNDYRFNLNKNELLALNTGSFKEKFKAFQEGKATNDDVIAVLHALILRSYGVISLDGDRFEKNEELAKAFEQSAAFDELFMSLAKNPEELNAFMVGIIPNDLQATFKVELAKQRANPEALK